MTYLSISILLGTLFLCHFLLVPLPNDPIPYFNLYIRIITTALFFVFLKNSALDFSSLLQSVLKGIAIHGVLSFLLSFFVIDYVFNVTTEDIYVNTFFYIFFYNSSFELFGITLYRNQGIFWEPGILQVYMNILFFICTFVKPNKKYQIISAFLVFTTYSTTGIGMLLLQFLVIVFSGKISKKQRMMIVTSLIVLVIPVFIINYQQKLNDNAEATTEITSSVLRIYDLMEGLNIMQKYPFTGIGVSDETYTVVKNANSILNRNYNYEFIDAVLSRRSSNSVLYFITRFGLPMAFLFFFMFYKQTLIQEKKILFFSIILISNMSEPLLMSPFFLLILCSAFYGLFKIQGDSTTKE